jgi:hypothetical protein
MSFNDTPINVPATTIASIKSALQRFFDAAKRHHEVSVAGAPRIEYSAMRDAPRGRAAAYLSWQLPPLAKQLRQSIEKWTKCDIDTVQSNWQFDPYYETKLLDTLWYHAYAHLNAEFLRTVVEDLRRHATDLKTFDAVAYEECAMSLIVDNADKMWNRPGYENLLAQVVRNLEERFGVKVTLLTHEEALEQLAYIIDAYGEEYARILGRADDLTEEARRLTTTALKA